MKKLKIASLLLTLLMIATIVPVAIINASAEPQAVITPDTSWYGDGTATSFELEDEADLLGFAKLLAEKVDFNGKTVSLKKGNYVLNSDMTAPVNPWFPDTAPAVDLDNGPRFRGIFDGNESVIEGIYNDGYVKNAADSSKTQGGFNSLFGIPIGGSTVKNVTFKNGVVLGTGAFLFAYMNQPGAVTIENVVIDNCICSSVAGTKNEKEIAPLLENAIQKDVSSLVIKNVTVQNCKMGKNGLVGGNTDGTISVDGLTITDCTMTSFANDGAAGMFMSENKGKLTVGDLTMKNLTIAPNGDDTGINNNTHSLFLAKNGQYDGATVTFTGNVYVENCKIAQAAGGSKSTLVGQCNRDVIVAETASIVLKDVFIYGTGGHGGVFGQQENAAAEHNTIIRNVKLYNVDVTGANSGLVIGITQRNVLIENVFVDEFCSTYSTDNVSLIVGVAKANASVTIKNALVYGTVGSEASTNAFRGAILGNGRDVKNLTVENVAFYGTILGGKNHGCNGSFIGCFGRTNSTTDDINININSCIDLPTYGTDANSVANRQRPFGQLDAYNAPLSNLTFSTNGFLTVPHRDGVMTTNMKFSDPAVNTGNSVLTLNFNDYYETQEGILNTKTTAEALLEKAGMTGWTCVDGYLPIPTALVEALKDDTLPMSDAAVAEVSEPAKTPAQDEAVPVDPKNPATVSYTFNNGTEDVTEQYVIIDNGNGRIPAKYADKALDLRALIDLSAFDTNEKLAALLLEGDTGKISNAADGLKLTGYAGKGHDFARYLKFAPEFDLKANDAGILLRIDVINPLTFHPEIVADGVNYQLGAPVKGKSEENFNKVIDDTVEPIVTEAVPVAESAGQYAHLYLYQYDTASFQSVWTPATIADASYNFGLGGDFNGYVFIPFAAFINEDYEALPADATIDEFVLYTRSESGSTCFSAEFNLISAEIVTIDCEAAGDTHAWVAGETVAPTCTTAGYTAYSCTKCESTKQDDVVPALGHDWNYTEENCETAPDYLAPTPDTAGSYTHTCQREGCGATEVVNLAPLKHTLVLKETVAPTCTTDGYDLYYCTFDGIHEGDTEKCTYTEQRNIVPMTGHNMVDVKKQAPDCTNVGWGDYKACSNEGCDCTEGYNEIPALGHVEEDVAAVDPTCTTDGYTAGKQCQRCKEYTEGHTVIPMLGHTWATVEKTCVVDGGTACSVCGEYDTTKPIDKATGHVEVDVAGKAATCGETGLTDGKQCSVCSEWIVPQVEIAKIKYHTYVSVVTKPTCTEGGFTTKTCSVCGAVTVTDETAAKGHKETTVKGTPATCTEAGKTDGKKCSVCELVLTAQEDIPALGHTEVEIAAIAATCTEAGKTAGKKCSVCETVLTAPTDVAALGHKAGEWEIVTEAAKGVEGKQVKKCTVCGAEVESEVIEALKGGCGSSIALGSSALLMTVVTIATGAFFSKKKH